MHLYSVHFSMFTCLLINSENNAECKTFIPYNQTKYVWHPVFFTLYKTKVFLSSLIFFHSVVGLICNQKLNLFIEP